MIRETIGRDLPRGFQRFEFLMEKGFVDLIRPRPEMRATLTRLFAFMEDEPLARPSALAASASANGQT